MSNKGISIKVTAGVTLEFVKSSFDYESIVYGTMSISQGRGRKKLQLEFVWNMELDKYPRIKDRSYNKDEVVQLAGMLLFYDNLRKEIK